MFDSESQFYNFTSRTIPYDNDILKVDKTEMKK